MRALIIGMLLGAASLWLPFKAVDPMARLIVPAIALLATSIFPCMSLAVGSLKAEQRAPIQVDELYTQLHTIMRVLVVAFVLAVASVALIVGLSGLLSLIELAGPADGVGTGSNSLTTDMVKYGSRAMLFVICIFLTFLAGRVIAVGKAFFVILDINRKHALLVARSKVQSERDKALEAARKHRFSPDSSTPRELERG